MSVSPTTPAAPRNHSPAGDHPSTLPAPSPLLLRTTRPGALTGDDRRPSIQFLTHNDASLPRGSPKRERGRRRISSPPPPPVFQPRVSFDTFDKPADFIEENSFTLVAKHKDYEYTKRSRTFLCGCDDNEYSDYALQWLIDELVDDGDEIVCLRVVEKDDTLAGDRSVEKGRYRSEAETLMKNIQGKNHENKAINLILEFAVGKVNKVIDEMINMYEPAILVVGTRGRSLAGFQGLLPGSVSKYCLQHSPVPVIVVRPSSKRDKARTKRALDPNRHAYKDLLEKSGSGGNLLDSEYRNMSIAESQQASDDEAAAVAAAVGYKPTKRKTPLAQTEAAPTDNGTEDAEVAAALMKSPELQNLESPDISDPGTSSSDEDGGVSTATKEASTITSNGESVDKLETLQEGVSGLNIQDTPGEKSEVVNVDLNKGEELAEVEPNKVPTAGVVAKEENPAAIVAKEENSAGTTATPSNGEPAQKSAES